MSFIGNNIGKLRSRVDIPLRVLILILFANYTLSDESVPVSSNSQLDLRTEDSSFNLAIDNVATDNVAVESEISVSSLKPPSNVTFRDVESSSSRRSSKNVTLSATTSPELDPVYVHRNSSSGHKRPNRKPGGEGYDDDDDDDDNSDEDPPGPETPADETEAAVRNFKSDHETPREVPTKVAINGSLGTPAPDLGIKLDFVPKQSYIQVRRTDTVKRLPQSEAYKTASTPEEKDNAGRLREVVSHKKSQEVYEEQGYEDAAYDHGGYKKKGEMHEKKVAIDKGRHGTTPSPKHNRKGKDKIEAEASDSSQRKTHSGAPHNTTAEKLIFYPKVEAAIESVSNYKSAASNRPSTSPSSSKRRPQASHSHSVKHYKKHPYTPPEFEGAVIEKFVVINGKQIPIFRKNLKPMKTNLRTRVTPDEEDGTRLKNKKRLNKKKVYSNKNHPDVPTTYHPDPEVFANAPKIKYVSETPGKYSHSYGRPSTKFHPFYSDTRPSMNSAYHHTHPGPLRYFNKVEVIEGKPKHPPRQKLNQQGPRFPDNSEIQSQQLPNRPIEDFEHFRIKERPALSINPPSTEISIFGDPDTSPWVPIIPPPEYQNPAHKVTKGVKKSPNGPAKFKGNSVPSNFDDDDGPIVNDKFIGNFPDFPGEIDMKPPKAKLPQKHLKRPKQSSWLVPTHELADDFKFPESRPIHSFPSNNNFNSNPNQYTNHGGHSYHNHNAPIMIKTVVKPYASEIFGDDESDEDSSEVIRHQIRKPMTIAPGRRPIEQTPSKLRNVKKPNKAPTKYSYFNRENESREPYEPTFGTLNKQKNAGSFKLDQTNFKIPNQPNGFRFDSDSSSGPMGGQFLPFDEQPMTKKPYRQPPKRVNNERIKNNSRYNGRLKNQNHQSNQFSDGRPFGGFHESGEHSYRGEGIKTEHSGERVNFGDNMNHFTHQRGSQKPQNTPFNQNQMNNGFAYPDFSPQFNVHSSYSFEPTFTENLSPTIQPQFEVAPTYPTNYVPVPPPTSPLDSSKFFSENHEYVEPKPPKELMEGSSLINQNLNQNLKENRNNSSQMSVPLLTTFPPIIVAPETSKPSSVSTPQERPTRYRWRPRKQQTQTQQPVDWSGKSGNSSRGETHRRRNRPKTEQTQVHNLQTNLEKDSITKPSNNYFPSVINPLNMEHHGGSNDQRHESQYYPKLQLHYTVPDFSAIGEKRKTQAGTTPVNRPDGNPEGQSTEQVIHKTSTPSDSENRLHSTRKSPHESIKKDTGSRNDTKSSTEISISATSHASKPYQTVPRQNFTQGETAGGLETTINDTSIPNNSRHPFLPKDISTDIHGQQVKYSSNEEQKNQSNVLVTYYGSFDMPEQSTKNEKPNLVSEPPKKPEEIASIKYIENLTLQHYSVPENTLPYQPLSNTQQNRIINIANELNKDPPASEKNITNRRQDTTKSFIQSYTAYPYSAVDGRNERSFNFTTKKQAINVTNGTQTQDPQNFDRLPLTVHINRKTSDNDRILSYSDLLEQLQKQRLKTNSSETSNKSEVAVNKDASKNRTRRSVDKNKKRTLLEVASSGTTAFIPVDLQKFPFYASKSSDPTAQFSPLRYAQNPKSIPKKSGHGMEFYESRSHIDCDDPEGPQNVVPTRSTDGEWNQQPQPEGPRLSELGDKIKCFRRKFFDEDPLDNPFFKEDFIGPPQVVRVAKVIYDDEDANKNDDTFHSTEDDDMDDDEEESDDDYDFPPDGGKDRRIRDMNGAADENVGIQVDGDGKFRGTVEDELKLYADIISSIRNMHLEVNSNKSIASNNSSNGGFNETVKAYSNHKNVDSEIGENNPYFQMIANPSQSDYEPAQFLDYGHGHYKELNKTISNTFGTKNPQINQTNSNKTTNSFIDSTPSQDENKVNQAYSEVEVQNFFQNRSKINENFPRPYVYETNVGDAQFKSMSHPIKHSKPFKYLKSPYVKKYKPTIYKTKKIVHSGTKYLIKKHPSHLIKHDAVDDYASDPNEYEEVVKNKENIKLKATPSKQIIQMIRQGPVSDWLSPLDNFLDESVDYSDPPIKIVHNFYNFNVAPKRPAALTNEIESEPEYSNYNYNYNYYDENSPGNEDPESPEYPTSPEYSQSRPEEPDYVYNTRKLFEPLGVTFITHPAGASSLAAMNQLPQGSLRSKVKGGKVRLGRFKRASKSERSSESHPFSNNRREGKSSSSSKNSTAIAVNNLLYSFIDANKDANQSDVKQKNSNQYKKNLERITEHLKKFSKSAETFMTTEETVFYPKIMALRELKIDTTRRPRPIRGFISRHNPVYSSRYNKDLIGSNSNSTERENFSTSTAATSTSTSDSTPRFKLRFPPRNVKIEVSSTTVKPLASESNSNFSVVPPSRSFPRKVEDIFRRPKHVDVYESLRRLKGEISPDFMKSKLKTTHPREASRGSKVFSDEFHTGKAPLEHQARFKGSGKELLTHTETNQLTDFITTVNPMKDSLIYVVSPRSGQGQWMKEVKLEYGDVPWHLTDSHESRKVHQKSAPPLTDVTTGIESIWKPEGGFHYGLREMQHRKTPFRSRVFSPSDQGSSSASKTFDIVKLIDGGLVEEKVKLDVFSADLNH